jgi:tetratricopeptide (TPR) repeat protein
MADTKRTVDSPSKAKIFISYSRKDATFANQLEEALKTRDFQPLIDRSDIYVFEDWWQRIKNLIVQADTVISVLSPDYVSSDICKKEVKFAASRNKRFAPIEYQPVDCKLIPSALERLNFEFLCADEQFEQSMDRLAEALQTDIDWIRKHTEFGAQAHDWVADGKPRGLLLRSPILEEAERWIASRPRTAPLPTEEIVAFIAESRRATLRQRDLLTASLGAGLLLAVSFVGVFHHQTVRAKQALDATEQIANTLVIDLGQDPRVVSLSPDLRREMFDRAIQGYDQVIKLDRKNPKTYNDRGNAFFEKGNLDGDAAAYEQAIADYNHAIALDRKYGAAYSDHLATTRSAQQHMNAAKVIRFNVADDLGHQG